MDIIFMGTPSFACPSLSALVRAGHRISAVVTRADKPRGRSGRPMPTEVKEEALRHGLTVNETENVSAPDFVQRLAALRPQLGVVAAFGEKLSAALLAVPVHGYLNVHASLLPKYRGAAPITWAVVNGEKQTGITIIRLTERMDAGPMLVQRATDIGPEETAGDLHDRLANLGAEALLEAVAAVEAGVPRFTPQDENQATRAPILTKDDGIIRWDAPPRRIKDFVRGMTPWPGACSFLKRQRSQSAERLTILQVDAVEPEISAALPSPGTVIAGTPGIRVAAGNGAVLIRRVKPSGGRDMTADEYLRGHAVAPGDTFRTEP